MSDRLWNVYLSGEIHTPWRAEIETECKSRNIPVRLMGPEISHDESDHCGETILGPEASPFWKDHKAAKINTIRNRSVIKNCDIMVVRFGEKYRQWNAAFDAGFAASQDISIITLHDESLDHALKEIDAVALATTRNIKQVTDILAYITRRLF
ncbi:MAG: YtoQ family protein [Pseudomonadota bacterium]